MGIRFVFQRFRTGKAAFSTTRRQASYCNSPPRIYCCFILFPCTKYHKIHSILQEFVTFFWPHSHPMVYMFFGQFFGYPWTPRAKDTVLFAWPNGFMLLAWSPYLVSPPDRFSAAHQLTSGTFARSPGHVRTFTRGEEHQTTRRADRTFRAGKSEENTGFTNVMRTTYGSQAIKISPLPSLRKSHFTTNYSDEKLLHLLVRRGSPDQDLKKTNKHGTDLG